MTKETWWWKILDRFVDRLNNIRALIVVPSDMIFVDKRISCWYGYGGEMDKYQASNAGFSLQEYQEWF